MRQRSRFLSRSAPDPFFKLFRNDFYYKRGLRSFREKRRQLRSHCFQCYLPGRPAHGPGGYFKIIINEDELRILDLVSNLDENDLLTGNRLYVASKYALARWVRRHSASYAANGVRINAVAPGNVNTSMTATMSVDEKTALNALPIPTKYGKETLMEPDEIASAINFLISKEARGVNGIIMFVDGGTDALLNSEKVY